MLLIAAAVGTGAVTAPAQVSISEFMADNAATLADEDGDFSDWIEIQNAGASPVDLAGYVLSDDETLATGWTFPSRVIEPGGHLVVFASGKTKPVTDDSELHTSFGLDQDGEYLGLRSPSGAIVSEFRPSYPPQREDVSYGIGLAGDQTTHELTPTVFEFSDEATRNFAQVRVVSGGGGAAFDASDSLATGSPGTDQQRYLWFDYSAGLAAVPPGETVVSATATWEGTPLETFGAFTTDMGLFPSPGANYGADAVFPGSAGSEIVDYYAANPPAAAAEVDSSGGAARTVEWDAGPLVEGWLADPDAPAAGQFIVLNETQPAFIRWTTKGPALTVVTTDYPNTEPGPVYFQDPTPGEPNGSGVVGFVADTEFSVDRGIYTDPVTVEITSDTEGAVIVYTIDGEVPSLADGIGTVYSGPLEITETTALRARAFLGGWEPSNTDTQSYIFPADVIRQDRDHAIALGFPARNVGSQVYQFGMAQTVVNADPDAVIECLKAIPTISMTIRQFDFSDRRNGIYSNASQHGVRWERPGSLELINEDGLGTGQFQIDCGIRIRGGFSRSGSNPKHAFRLFFRQAYGAGKLRYPLFGDEGVSEFDKMDLRTSQNYSWAFQNDRRNTFLREVFGRDSQRAMGDPYTRSRYYHLYINGVYWGLFMTQERAEESYGASYFGGEPDDYDVVKSAGSSGGYNTEVTSGTFDEWRELWEGVRDLRTSGSVADYFKLQGLAPDGVTPTGDPVLLDPANLAAYMLAIFYTGNYDAPLSTFLDNASNNWFAVRNRETDDRGFAVFVHDGEHGMGTDRTEGENDRSTDRTGPWAGRGRNWKGETMYGNVQTFSKSNPQYLNEDLAFIEEYRVLFGDIAHRHFVAPNATMGEEAAIARIGDRMATVEQVILAESARWGEGRSTQSVAAWERERDDLLTWVREGSNQEMLMAGDGPGRAATIIAQLRAYKDRPGTTGDYLDMPLYPAIDAPVYSQHGGQIGAGVTLTIDDPNTGGDTRVVYYRADGGDPRAVGGAVDPAAVTYTAPFAISGPTVLNSRVLNTTTGEWSALNSAEFVIGTPAAADNLAVAEVNYHPADPTPEELAQPFISDDGDFEFLEFINISDDTIDLTGVRITSGVIYEFPFGSSLAPGARVLVVKNQPAFEFRYSGVTPAPAVLGEWVSGSLNNGGETIAVLDRDAATIRSFRYEDSGPWPSGADGQGYSLVLFDPTTDPDHDMGENWRSSATLNGNPGSGQEVGYDAWATAVGAGPPDADDNGDGFVNFFAYAVGAGPTEAITPFLPTATSEKAPAGFVFFRSVFAVDALYAMGVSESLTAWEDGTDRFAVEGVETVMAGVERVVLDLRGEAVPEGGTLFGRLEVSSK